MFCSCCDRFLNWYRDPYKDLFKVFKFVLAILRNLLFIGYLILIYARTFNGDYDPKPLLDVPSSIVFYILDNNEQHAYPLVALVAMLVYNWRFVLTIFTLFLILMSQFVCCTCCCLCNLWYDWKPSSKTMKKLLALIYKLNWSHFDWKCFKLKYYIYLFDSVRYFIYLISVIAIYLLELVILKANQGLLNIYAVNSALYVFNVAIEMYRFIQVTRDNNAICDIFPPNGTYSCKLRKMISEEQMDSLVCTSLNECLSLDTVHRVFAHPKEFYSIKFKRIAYNTWGVNLVIGFHQTSIKNARKILRSAFRPSTSGMLGPGIYFANNYDVTERKRNQRTPGGAIFCALIDLGRVYEMKGICYNNNYSQTYNSKYLHHAGGKTYDEFVIYSESQILEYSLIVEHEAIKNYRLRRVQPCFNWV